MDTFLLFATQNILVFILLAFCLLALFIYEGKKGGKKIDPGEVTRLINKESAVIVDLRPSEEFSSGHIAGSLNISPQKAEQQLSSLKHPKDVVLILVCKTGSSSKGVGGTLLKSGYSKVNLLRGGMMSWQNSGLPLAR